MILTECMVGLLDLSLFGLVVVLVLYLFQLRKRYWTQYYPLSEQHYFSQYPHLKKGATVRCCQCGATSISSRGRHGQYSHQRYVTCLSCLTRLYHINK